MSSSFDDEHTEQKAVINTMFCVWQVTALTSQVLSLYFYKSIWI